MRYPVSVFIIAKDEEDRIPQAIKSVINWVDEVIVIDSGSTDGTVQTAKSLGASVVYNKWEGYGRQKIFGESLCKNDWILNIDADEEVSLELAEEIKSMFATNSLRHMAYSINVKIMGFSQNQPNWLAPYTKTVRLYNKNFAGFRDSTVHDSVIFREQNKESFGKLNGIVYHRCFRSHKHAVEKINFYTTMQAEDLFKRGKSISSIRIICEPVLAFLKAYFLRRYFLMGVEGYIQSRIYSFARVLRLAKARELQSKKINNP